MSSPWLPLSLLKSCPTHLTLLCVSFPPSAPSPSCFVRLPTPCFASFSFFPTFLLFVPLWVILSFLVSCVLTTSPHLPSSDPSGPETPSSSAHCPLPPPGVLTAQNTALCAAVHTLGLRRSSLPMCVCPPGSALVGVCMCVW